MSLPSSPKEVLQALISLITTTDLAEIQRIVEAHANLLLTDDAGQVAAMLIRQYAGDDNVVRALEHRRTLLQSCRRQGIKNAFASLTRSQNVADDLNAILQALSYPARSSAELPQRLNLCQQAMALVNRYQQPELWADLNGEMGNNLLQNPYGDRADNLEQAMGHFQQTLKVYTREAFPERWAAVHNAIAEFYRSRIRGDRAENLEQSIDHFQQALNIYTRETFPEGWAMVQNNIANAYRNRIRGDRADNLEQAIGHFQQALKVYTRKALPEDWAMTQNNLALAYIDRICGERADNLEQAIDYFQQALKVRTREAFPEDWAMVQNNIAEAYRNRIRGNRADNLEQSIDHCNQALKVYTREALPDDWAMTQNNLALAYFDRICGERADNLEQAIGHFEQSLKVYTREVLPENWAMTQDNLASAYFYRIRGERADNLEQAIGLYHQALKVRTREAFPEGWAKTQHNLANAYLKRIRGDRADNLEQAIDHFQQALKVRTREAFPERWAMTQSSLASAYSNRIRGERADNLEQAIGLDHQALKVYTRETFPKRWADIQHNLALSYVDRIRGERADNLKQAIDHFQQALKVRTRDAFPADHRHTQRILGTLHFEQHNWPHALTAYQSAIAAGNELLASAYTEAGREAEVRETAQLFANASYCMLKSHRYGEALVMLERGKTRLLTEALALADIAVLSLPQKYRDPLQAARKSLKELEARMRLRTDMPGTVDPEGPSPAAQLQEKRAAFVILIETIRQNHPDFMPTGLDLPNIVSLIPTEGALVAPVITTQGSFVFVIPHGAKEVTPEHVIQLDKFKKDNINNLLIGSENEPGWLSAYLTFHDTRHLKYWQEAIVSVTKRLWQTPIEPIHQRLSALSVKRVLLLPAGGLQLLPLHAAWYWDEDGQKHTLLDDYEITYAPSAYALDIANRRAKTRRTTARKSQSALVVGINDYKNLGQLLNAALEAETIAGMFGTKPLLDADATTSAVKFRAVDTAYVHMSCHGMFKWKNPMESALYLAQDEPLKLSEIISELDLSSTLLVTLSACETGISDVRQLSDEYLGLPAGFLQAGAPAIVSSLWTVDDQSTALLMERFYRNHIERGMTGPAALREAQLWLRDTTRKELGDYYKAFIRMTAQDAFEAFMDISGAPDDRPYENPFYWAAFTYNGASI